jgi:hypothetical protein
VFPTAIVTNGIGGNKVALAARRLSGLLETDSARRMAVRCMFKCDSGSSIIQNDEEAEIYRQQVCMKPRLGPKVTGGGEWRSGGSCKSERMLCSGPGTRVGLGLCTWVAGLAPFELPPSSTVALAHERQISLVIFYFCLPPTTCYATSS